MRNRVLLAAVAAVTVMGAALAGCSASPTHPAKSSSSPHPSVTNTIPAIPSGIGIIQSTSMTSCGTKPGHVSAQGSVVLPAQKTGNVVISVSWVNSSNSSVLARAVTTVKSPTTKTHWSLSATLPAGATSVRCVLGAVIPK